MTGLRDVAKGAWDRLQQQSHDDNARRVQAICYAARKDAASTIQRILNVIVPIDDLTVETDPDGLPRSIVCTIDGVPLAVYDEAGMLSSPLRLRVPGCLRCGGLLSGPPISDLACLGKLLDESPTIADRICNTCVDAEADEAVEAATL